MLAIEGDAEQVVRARELLLGAGSDVLVVVDEHADEHEQATLEQTARAVGLSRRQLECAGLALKGLSNC